MKNRTCIFCESIILECMGGVVAKDFIMATDNEIPFPEIREVCGKCALTRKPEEITQK